MNSRKIVLVVGLLLAILAVISASSLNAIKGTITDKETGKPVDKVKIQLVSVKSSAISYEVYSDSKGYFYKSGLGTDNYQVIFEKEGYMPVASSIHLGIGQTSDLSVTLEAYKQMPTNVDVLNGIIKMINSQKYDTALKELDGLIQKDNNNPIILYYRAYALDKSGLTNEAVEEYIKTIQLKPDFILAISDLAKIHAKRKDYQEGAKWYKKAFDLGMNDPMSIYNYGICLVNLNDNPKACQVFEKLIQIDPNYSEAYYQLGIIYLGLGDVAKTKTHLQKFIELDPDNPDAATAQEILKSL